MKPTARNRMCYTGKQGLKDENSPFSRPSQDFLKRARDDYDDWDIRQGKWINFMNTSSPSEASILIYDTLAWLIAFWTVISGLFFFRELREGWSMNDSLWRKHETSDSIDSFMKSSSTRKYVLKERNFVWHGRRRPCGDQISVARRLPHKNKREVWISMGFPVSSFLFV